MTTAVNNTLVGALVGDAITEGSNNTVLGYAALSAATVGNSNTAVGKSAMHLNVAADRNVAIGEGSLLAMTRASTADTYNTAVGFNAGSAITSGEKNTIIGGLAGDALTTGDSNIIIGVSAAASAVGVDNEIIIGNLAVGGGTNSAVIGTTQQQRAVVHGLVKPVARVTADITTSLANTLYNLSDTTARTVTLPDCATLSQGATFEFVMTGKPGSGSHKVICHTDTVLRGQVIAVAINANNTTATTSTSTTIFTPQVTTIEGGAADDLGLAFNGTTTGAIGTRVKFTVTGADEMFVEGFVHHSGSVSTPFVTS
tara:strand:- start:38 stop:976 length:939 start_codon:yes stop_codon:yes gene_type:complete